MPVVATDGPVRPTSPGLGLGFGLESGLGLGLGFGLGLGLGLAFQQQLGDLGPREQVARLVSVVAGVHRRVW